MPVSSLPIWSAGKVPARSLITVLEDIGPYLGCPIVHETVEWIEAKDGGAVLVRKLKRKSAPEGDDHVEREEAVLSIVGGISEKRFFFTSNGDMQYRTSSPDILKGTLAQCWLEPADDDALHGEWERSFNNLQRICDMAPDVQPNRCGLVEEGRVLIRHELIGPKRYPLDLPFFAQEGYPIDISAAPKNVRSHLEKIKDTHELKPAPIYRRNCSFIEPSDWRFELKPAQVVEYHFGLHHKANKDLRLSSFTPVLRDVRVWKYVATVESPRKRKLVVDIEEGPSFTEVMTAAAKKRKEERQKEKSQK
ncbi:hypothetical protein FRB99_008662 [Tulasnella sp. 403]|nr:hypothetical protein FRB99_008662 [Tulasnella sp. 403]